MDQKKIRVLLLFRQPGRFFSLERIFRQLTPILDEEVTVSRWEAPYSRASLRDIWNNLRSARQCRADVYHVT
ncbi:MAG TPA: hypothetical protein VKQ52_20160, partial [Puia sp.]|nr:hypothetical protein [Puia sp.]